jgi:expansin (peptidoglycan-binding protein)
MLMLDSLQQRPDARHWISLLCVFRFARGSFVACHACREKTPAATATVFITDQYPANAEAAQGSEPTDGDATGNEKATGGIKTIELA